MTKDELVEKIAGEADISKKDAAAALNAVTSGIASALANGDSVSLTGFGVFSVSNRAARTGRNPRTGEAIEIPASRGVKFKPGKALKDAVK
ncbi:MAG: HU family DNA-binding protein [Thermodesulfobacteriota bacterium]|nr:MAG: HU family DNA-binding protein [Thermodesulfobacteriota bacterium]